MAVPLGFKSNTTAIMQPSSSGIISQVTTTSFIRTEQNCNPPIYTSSPIQQQQLQPMSNNIQTMNLQGNFIVRKLPTTGRSMSMVGTGTSAPFAKQSCFANGGANQQQLQHPTIVRSSLPIITTMANDPNSRFFADGDDTLIFDADDLMQQLIHQQHQQQQCQQFDEVSTSSPIVINTNSLHKRKA